MFPFGRSYFALLHGVCLLHLSCSFDANSSISAVLIKLHEKQQARCLADLISRNFEPKGPYEMITVIAPIELSAESNQIAASLARYINLLQEWPIEFTDGRRENFTPRKLCKNCPVVAGQKPSYRYNYQIPYVTKYFLLLYENEESFVNDFDYLRNLRTFNIYATFLVYLTNPVEEPITVAKDLYELLFKHDIYYALIVLHDVQTHDLFAYNLNFFHKTRTCYHDPIINHLDTCVRGVWRTNALLNSTFPKKPDLFNCSIDLLTVVYPPFVIDKKEGFEMDIVHALEELFNFTFNIIIDEQTSSWGAKYGDDWVGRLKTIKNRKIFGIGNIMIDQDMNQDFQPSVEYWYQEMRWVSPIAEIRPQWQILISVFRLNLWLTCILTYIVYVILCYYWSFSKHESKVYKRLSTICLLTFGYFIGAVIYVQPKSTLLRYLYGLMMILSFIVTAYYQTILISALTSDHLYPALDTTESIIESGIQIGGLSQYEDIFENTNNTLMEVVLERYDSYEGEQDIISTWLKKVANDRDTVTVLGTLYAKYALATNVSDVCYPSGDPKIHVGWQTLRNYPARMLASNNHLLMKHFSEMIVSFWDQGFIENWSSRYLAKLDKMDANLKWESEKSGEDIVFTFKHTQGAFFIVCFGNIAGIVVFFGEIAVYQYRQFKRRRLLKRLLRRRVGIKFGRKI